MAIRWSWRVSTMPPPGTAPPVTLSQSAPASKCTLLAASPSATAANRSGSPTPWTLDGVLEMFPALLDRLASMGNLLSGGEQQMLAIGRALMTNPKLLILDEATEGLAPLVRRDIWACLERLKRAGQAILVIDKNIEDLARIADRHYVIEKGHVVWSGTSDELRSRQDVLTEKLGV